MKEMTAALIGLLADNAGAGGKGDYYGVRMDKMTPDRSEFDLGRMDRRSRNSPGRTGWPRRSHARRVN